MIGVAEGCIVLALLCGMVSWFAQQGRQSDDSWTAVLWFLLAIPPAIVALLLLLIHAIVALRW